MGNFITLTVSTTKLITIHTVDTVLKNDFFTFL
jgi:hypothetical protein